jgi:hypothetical protein
MQGAIKFALAPGADPSIAILREVRRINCAERGVDTLAAGERL